MRKFFIFSVLALAGCNHLNPQPESCQMPIRISMGFWTRVTDNAFEPGDKAGIYVVNYNGSQPGTLTTTGNYVDNTVFNYTTTWEAENQLYWLDKTTKADFYCYIPAGTPISVESHSFSVKTDQSSLTNYKASEFLWGKAAGISPTEQVVPITTNRVMSNMLIYLKAGKGYTDETFAQAEKTVTITNVKSSASINLSNGIATATGTAGTIVPLNEGSGYRALVVPQTVPDGTSLISVNVDGVSYTFSKGFTFAANTQHKFTVTINKVSNGVDIGIGDWDVDDTDHGGEAE